MNNKVTSFVYFLSLVLSISMYYVVKNYDVPSKLGLTENTIAYVSQDETIKKS